MREIKFRAWDGETMYNVRAIVWHAGVPATVEVFAPDEPGGTKLLFWFELMEYTGLKDKNGREIYEGDTLEFVAYGKVYKGVVKFITGYFCIECEGAAPFLDDILARKGAMIIGNIYENPELLKKD